jgi:hypothetical protein
MSGATVNCSRSDGFPHHDRNSFAPGSIMQYVWTDDVQRFTGQC